MMQLSQTRPIHLFPIPSLLQLVQRTAAPGKTSLARTNCGLGFDDIADASQRATLKNGLKVWPNPYRGIVL